MSDVPSSGLGAQLLGGLLMVIGLLAFGPGFLLFIFVGAVWTNQAGSGQVVNPNAPLFFLLGLALIAGGVGLMYSGGRMWKRADG